jgi:hypothetical protein
MGALTANWKTLAMANSLVALDIDFTSDVASDLTTEITFDLVIRFDKFTELDEIGFL